MRWSDTIWQDTADIYSRILEMPFIKELSEGTLPPGKFRFYIAQDALYLEQFGRVLALTAAKAADVNDVLTYTRFAETAIVVEQALHASYFADFGVSEKGVMQPACHHYTHFLRSTAALDPVEVSMAATLPCFRIYAEVGAHIYAGHSSKDNPYQRWIDTYAGEDFMHSVERAIDCCDRVAEQSSPSVRTRMNEAFICAARMEFAFWDAAYRMHTWHI
ncbi:MAG: thiaminase II [Chitinophagaceae bacterium]